MDTEQDTLSAEQQETPAEQEYRALSVRLTLLDCQIEELTSQYDLRRFSNPKFSFTTLGTTVHADPVRDELEQKLKELYLARQCLLPRWSQLKFDLHLTR